MSDIQTELKQFAEVFNSELKHYFPCPEGEEKRVVEAMEYSVLNGGKRLRPFWFLKLQNCLRHLRNRQCGWEQLWKCCMFIR